MGPESQALLPLTPSSWSNKSISCTFRIRLPPNHFYHYSPSHFSSPGPLQLLSNWSLCFHPRPLYFSLNGATRVLIWKMVQNPLMAPLIQGSINDLKAVDTLPHPSPLPWLCSLFFPATQTLWPQTHQAHFSFRGLYMLSPRRQFPPEPNGFLLLLPLGLSVTFSVRLSLRRPYCFHPSILVLFSSSMLLHNSHHLMFVFTIISNPRGSWFCFALTGPAPIRAYTMVGTQSLNPLLVK